MVLGPVSAAATVPPQAEKSVAEGNGCTAQVATHDSVAKTAISHSGLIHTVIERETGLKLVDLRELWQYRELVWLLAARDLKTRYRQSLLGIAWSLMQPLFTLAVFVVFLASWATRPPRRACRMSSRSCAASCFGISSRACSSATANSLPGNVHLIIKVYCPRLVFPLSTVIVGLVDLAVSLVVLALVLVYYRTVPPIGVLLLPGFAAMAAMVALAVGLLIAALSVRWRDVRFMIPVLLQMGFFASPVIYETSALIPDRLRFLYQVNPMAGVLEGFRWSLVGAPGFSWTMFAVSGPLTALTLLCAFYLFRRVERTLPDYL